MNSLNGKFIVFDGPDGCGKTSQRDLLAATLESQGLVVVKCKDPGGSIIGDRIRHILLDYDLSEMQVRCETLLFMASRAQLVGEIIDPALRAGKVVLCDRFVSATCAYQGAAGYDIHKIIDLAPHAIGETWPDLTFILDVEVETGFQRTGRKPHHSGKKRKVSAGQHTMFDDAVPDAMEARPLEFHRRVREVFSTLPQTYPRPVRLVDTGKSLDQVHHEVLQTLRELYGEPGPHGSVEGEATTV